MTATTLSGTHDLTGVDCRLREHRRETFDRFYDFHLRYRAHPGAVYYVLPALAAAEGWTREEQLYAALVNGCTQNPVTTWLLMAAGPSTPSAWVAKWRAEYGRLAFDTDRRYHKKAFDLAVFGYVERSRGITQQRYWRHLAERGWPALWAAATAIPTFGRLSAWSYLEYVAILSGLPIDADDLMLLDQAGSRSHRNGLAWVAGREDLDWHASNPGFTGRYTPHDLELLAATGDNLLWAARGRNAGAPWAADVSRLTLESTLCTYKGWHRPNRRYPNVYNDMLHDRIRAAEVAWPGVDFGVFWRIRRDWLPPYLRLEDCPGDPGVDPVKQNHYLSTGRPVMMDVDYPDLANEFNDAARAGKLGTYR